MPNEPASSGASRALVIVNARVRTGDPQRPWADAVFVQGERIEGVGSSAELRKRAGGGARVIDAHGMLVLPVPGDTMIARGFPADLVIVDRTHGADGPEAMVDAEVVLRLEQGRATIDRDSLAG